MSNLIIAITSRLKDNQDTIANIWWYLYVDSINVQPQVPEMTAAVTSWVAKVKTAFSTCLPASAAWVDLTCHGYFDVGAPGTVLPVIVPQTGTGNQAGSRDSSAHCAILAFSMNDLIRLNSNSANIRRSHLAIGPLLNTAVGDDNTFIPSALGGTNAALLATAAGTPLNILGTNDGVAIRVSHVSGHAPVTAVTAYRAVSGAHFQSRAGFMRKRTNFR